MRRRTATAAAAATTDTQAPTTPTAIRVTSQTQTSVALSWGASTDDDYSHSIQYVVTVGSITRSTNYSSIVITNLATNHVYDVSVQAKDAAGNGSGIAHAAAFLESTPPSPPTSLDDVATVQGEPELKWDGAADKSGAIARYRLLANGVSLRLFKAPTQTVNLIDFVDCGGLLRGKTYTFTVQAFDASRNVSTQSAPLVVTLA